MIGAPRILRPLRGAPRAGLILLVLFTLAVPGCRSARTGDARTGDARRRGEHPERDYLSINRTSRVFLKDTSRQSRKMARQNLRDGSEFRRGTPGYVRTQRKQGLAFGADSIRKGDRENTRGMWAGLKRELAWDRDAFWRSVRFGHLDTGD